jgi:hypothetical protein
VGVARAIWDGRAPPCGTNRTKAKKIKFTVEFLRYELKKFRWKLRPINHGWMVLFVRRCKNRTVLQGIVSGIVAVGFFLWSMVNGYFVCGQFLS